MPWLVFYTTIAIAMVAFIAYKFFEKKNWFKGYISSQPFQGIDGLFCLILASYFLKVIFTPESSASLNLVDIQRGALFYIFLDLMILSFLLLHRINPIQVFGIQKLHWLRIFKIAVLWLLAFYPLIFLVQLLIENIGGKEVTPQPLVKFLIDTPRLFDRITVGLLAVVIAPLTEELIFRGYLYGVIRKYAGRLPAIFATACIFAGIHQHISAFPGLFLLALTLSFAYETTGCLLVPIVMHALFNLIGVFAAVFSPTISF